LRRLGNGINTGTAPTLRWPARPGPARLGSAVAGWPAFVVKFTPSSAFDDQQRYAADSRDDTVEFFDNFSFNLLITNNGSVIKSNKV